MSPLKLTEDEIREVREYVRQIYGERCVRCHARSREVHEIVPRSLRPFDWYALENMVVLCTSCHHWAEELGHRTREEAIRRFQGQALDRIAKV